jgi:autotransporter strand-loop-strand O-heptosyltransferase
LLRKEGITPVCIDRHGSFGNDGWWNEVPSSAVKKQGMNLQEMTNYIHHSEFFIGISSGLSWVAHALGKKVVMISGVTSLDNEFEEDTIRISNQNVCNGCINNPSVWFDPSDWLWCPFHKNTERQFECTKTITPDEVFLSIKENLLI